MRNKKFLSIFFTFTIFMFSGCTTKDNSINSNTHNNQEPVIEEEFCADCGQGGWEKMDKKCDKGILNKYDFKKCLMNYNWSDVNNETNTDEMENRYIEINSMEILNNPTPSSIKVIIYKQWAVDENGNLYLFGQLG